MKRLITLLGLVFLLALPGQLLEASPQYKGVILYATEVGAFALDISEGQIAGGLGGHASIWNPPLGERVDLHPAAAPEFAQSQVMGVHSGQQVGFAGDYAYSWNGSAESAVNLHPSGFKYSNALSTNGFQQVGDGAPESSSSLGHALLWNGSAESVIDLHPQSPYDFEDSHALNTDGTHQVGYAFGVGLGNDPRYHALLWNGSAASVVDLHPTHLSGITDSEALGVSGSQQVGVANTLIGPERAMLWNGSAASAVNLHPVGYESSLARATNGTQQVGFATQLSDSTKHAMLWQGSSDSAIDLHTLLPTTFLLSEAYEIDLSGRIYGIATNGSTDYYAVMWVPVPEPPAISLAFAIAASLTLTRHRPRKIFLDNSEEFRR